MAGLFWLLLFDVAVSVVVISIFGSPRTSLASAITLSVVLASVPAGAAAHAIRRRKPPFRFGIPATAVIVTIIWGVCSFGLFVRTYYGN